MRQVRLLPLLMSVALAIPLAATAADPYVPLQQRMTPEEFKALSAQFARMLGDESKS